MEFPFNRVSFAGCYLLVRLCFRPQRINWVKVDDDVPSHAVITGADLYIENLNKSYNGTYRCMASNSVGESFDDYILYVYGTQPPALYSLSLFLPLSLYLLRPSHYLFEIFFISFSFCIKHLK